MQLVFPRRASSSLLLVLSRLGLLRLLILDSLLVASGLALLVVLATLNGGSLGVFNNVGVLNPQLIGQPDGHRHGVSALDVESLDIPPTLGNKLLGHALNDSVDVLGQLLGSELGGADTNGGGGGGSKLHRGAAQSALDFLSDNQRSGERCALILLSGLLLRVLLDTLSINLLDLGNANRNWALAGLVEDLSESRHQASDNAVVGQEDIVLRKQLAAALKALVTSLQLAETDDLVDAGGNFFGENGVGNDVLDTALGIGSDQTDAEGWGRVEGVRDADLSGLQAVLVDNVLLCGEDEPDSLVVDRCLLIIGVVVTNQSLLSGRLLLLFLV